jgi:hypothetical protein
MTSSTRMDPDTLYIAWSGIFTYSSCLLSLQMISALEIIYVIYSFIMKARNLEIWAVWFLLFDIENKLSLIQGAQLCAVYASFDAVLLDKIPKWWLRSTMTSSIRMDPDTLYIAWSGIFTYRSSLLSLQIISALEIIYVIFFIHS